MKFLLHKLFPITPRIVVMPSSVSCGQRQMVDVCAQDGRSVIEPLGKVAQPPSRQALESLQSDP